MRKTSRLLCTLIAWCFTLQLHAVSAYPGLIEMRQPDGYIIKCRIMGDEFLHWIESEDGYTLLYDENHFLTLAITDDDGNLVASKLVYRNENDRDIPIKTQMRRIGKHARFSASQQEEVASSRMLAAQRRRIVKPASPVVGERKFLVVMMEFPDKPFKHTQAEFYALMNEEGYTTDGNQGSVRDFYRENSFGQLDLVSDVAGIYQAKHDMAYYGNNTNGNAQALAIEAMAAAAADYDLKDYDSDGDGYIDGLHIIFSGYGEEAGGGTDCIWSHECTTTGVFCTYDGVKMNAYSCSPELRGSSGTGMSYIGVICHEIGHALGTPDFYDTNYATGGQYGATGNWDVMGSGSWNGNGACPAHFNPYTKIYDYQWSGVQNGNRAVCATLNAKTKGDFIRIDTQQDGEYFLLEYRQKTGFDSRIPGHGLMIWRATDDLSRRNANTINAYHKQQFYPIAANATVDIPNSTPSSYGTTNAASTPFPGSNGVTEITDETTPSMKSWEGKTTEYPITNIVENTASGYVTFDISGGDYGTAYGLEIGKATLTSLTATWSTPQTDMKVMLLANTEDTFGTPENRLYTAGEFLDGGGEVVYVGTDTEFTHHGLMEHTTYYYRICTWVEETQTWVVSSTHKGRTKTGTISTFPFFDALNSSTLDEAYEEEIVFGTSKHWVMEKHIDPSKGWALMFNPCDGFTHQQSRLLLPLLDFTGAQCAFLSLDYRNWINSVKLMYRTSPDDNWKPLCDLESHRRALSAVSGIDEFTVFINSGTHLDINLPELSPTYQLSIVGDFSPIGNSMGSFDRMTVNNLKVSIDDAAVVSTLSVGEVGATSAAVKFTALAGTAAIVETGIAYSTDKSTWTKSKANPGVYQLTGLARNTSYYIRAYAQTDDGKFYYGSIKQFTTLSFTSGSGTKEEPILITSLSDWNQLRSVVAGGNDCEGSHFALTTSLTLSKSTMLTGSFNGILDGRGNTLSYSSTGIVDYFIQVLGDKGEIHHLNATTGPLVGTNYGVIHDCRVNFTQSYANTGDINSFGFIAGRNYNVIYACDVYSQSFYYEQGYIGGICGWNFSQVFKCCFNGSLLANNNSKVGGIAATNNYKGTDYGIISQCVNKGTVGVQLNEEGRAWSNYVGGIVGTTYGIVDQCVNRGTVTSGCSSNVYDNSNQTGGIAGFLNKNVAVVSNCLNEGTVNTSYNLADKTVCAGGIAGYGYLANIKNCISVGQVNSSTSTTAYNHAIIGTNNQTGVDNCYYLNTPTDSYATQLTAEQMKAESLVNSLNENNGAAVWTVGTSHPELLMESSSTSLMLSVPTSITQTSASVAGFAIAPEGCICRIEWRTKDDGAWNYVEVETGRDFAVTLRGLTPATLYELRLATSTDAGWEYSETKVFATEFTSTGTADDPILIPDLTTLQVFRETVHQGNQYSNQIIRLTADIDLCGDKGQLWEPITQGVNGAFAGEFDGNGHIIRNMKVVSSASTAGFFGTTYKCYVHDLTLLDGDITNYATRSQNGYNGGVGGFLGDNISYANDGRPLIERCSFTGTITGGNAIGGIAGTAKNCDIIDCYAVATIHDPSNTALKGGITSEGNATNCYFAGKIINANQPNINYSVIVGRKNTTTAVVANSYYENDQISFGGNVGTRLTSNEMKDGTLLSKLSSELWIPDNTAAPVNGGYPVLASQSAPHLWVNYSFSGETINLTGTFYGAEKNYSTRGFEICHNPDGENNYQVLCESANTFTTTIRYTAGQYLKFRAFARENDAFTAYSDWVTLDGEVPETTAGDVNGDSYVDASDIQSIINIITGTSPTSSTADVNGDDEVDVGDIQAVLNIMNTNTQDSPGTSTTTAMNTDACFTAGDLTLKQGGTGQLLIGMTNSETDLSAFQFKLYLPDGVTPTTNTNGKIIYTLSERIKDYTLSITPTADGSYQFIAYSMSADAIKGTSGTLLELSVTAAYTFAATASGSLNGAKIANLESQTARCTDVGFSLTPIIAPVSKDFTVDNITYHYDKDSPSNTVTVIGHTLSGGNGTIDLVIPGTVSDGAVDYNVTAIGDGAFNSCNPLRSVVVSANVKQLSNRAFRWCRYLISVQLPEGLETIGTTEFQSAMGTFHQCSLLKEINFPSTVTLIGRGAFSGCTSLVSAALPNSLTTLGSCAFDGCSGLTAVSLSQNIPEIAMETFRNCSSLTSITIPSRMTSIGTNAFSNCTSLTDVTVEATSPCSILSSSFPLRANTTLYVPADSKTAYGAATYWKDFKAIIEIRLGDVNGNGGIDIGDAVSIVNYLVGKQSETFIEKNADTNKNGGIDIGDAVTIVNILVGKDTSISHTIIEGNDREPQ